MRKNGKTVLIAAFILFDLAGRLQASDEATIQSARKEGSLVVYTSMTVDQAQKLNDAFRSKYPFLQINMFRAVGERLLTKIMTEAQAGKFDFDIVQSAETQAYFLKKRNLLGRYLSPELKNIQRGFFDAEGYWSAVYMMPNVIGYNTRMVQRSEVPTSDEELLNPKWKGKIGMDHTKPEWFAWRLKRMGEDAKRKGAPVDWVAQDPVCTKFQPIGISAKAPHPNAAKLFVDFILSEDGQKIIASFGRVPTRRGVPTTVHGLDKVNFVIDDIGAGDDFNRNYELFRNAFNAPKF